MTDGNALRATSVEPAATGDATPARRRSNGRARPWTPAEDEVLRARTVPKRTRRRFRFDWPAILAALPGRTQRAVVIRRQALGLPATLGGRKWTAAEDKIVRDDFSEDGRRTLLEKLPGRSWVAIFRRAQKHGFGPRPQGWAVLSVEAEAERFGRTEAERVVRWANHWAPLVGALCEWGYQCALLARAPHAAERGGYDDGGVPTRRHTTTSAGCRPDFDTSRCIVLCEEGAFRAAAHRWLAWESSTDAGERHGISPGTAARALVREGYFRRNGGRSPLRFPPAWADDAIARRPPSGRNTRAGRRAARRSP